MARRILPTPSIWNFKPILQFSVAALATVNQSLADIQTEEWGFWYIFSTRANMICTGAAAPAGGVGAFVSGNPCPVMCDGTVDAVPFQNTHATLQVDVTILARETSEESP